MNFSASTYYIQLGYIQIHSINTTYNLWQTFGNSCHSKIIIVQYCWRVYAVQVICLLSYFPPTNCFNARKINAYCFPDSHCGTGTIRAREYYLCLSIHILYTMSPYYISVLVMNYLLKPAYVRRVDYTWLYSTTK